MISLSVRGRLMQPYLAAAMLLSAFPAADTTDAMASAASSTMDTECPRATAAAVSPIESVLCVYGDFVLAQTRSITAQTDYGYF